MKKYLHEIKQIPVFNDVSAIGKVIDSTLRSNDKLKIRALIRGIRKLRKSLINQQERFKVTGERPRWVNNAGAWYHDLTEDIKKCNESIGMAIDAEKLLNGE